MSEQIRPMTDQEIEHYREFCQPQRCDDGSPILCGVGGPVVLRLIATIDQLRSQLAEKDREIAELLNSASVWRNRCINAEEELAGTNRLERRP